MSNPARASWGSKLGLILASAGSAIGLGNLWRFPYIAAENGGGSFLFIYLLCTFSVGITLLFAESALGVKTKSDPAGAFAWINPHLKFIGTLGVFTSAIIVPYYSVVGGWIIAYIAKSFCMADIGNFETHFSEFIASPVSPVLYFYAYMLATAAVVYMGIEHGIEKFCKWMMPLLFLLLLVLMLRVLTLENAWEGVKFFFLPDFSKITGDTLIKALGQAFFSLSIGCGTILTYSSYVKKNDNMLKTSSLTAISDTVFALIAGIAIMPAVFAFNMSPSEGPGLVFIILPEIFCQIPGGSIIAIVFFFTLLIAALTSSISLIEVAVTFIIEEFHLKRKVAILLSLVICTVLGSLSSLSQGILSDVKIFGLSFFDSFDYLSANILMPLGGLFLVIFVGWIMKKPEVIDEMSNNHTLKISKCIYTFVYYIIRYVAPFVILSIMITGLL